MHTNLTPQQLSNEFQRVERNVQASGATMKSIVTYAVGNYGHIMPAMMPYTLADLAELVRTWYDCNECLRNRLVADVLDCMSNQYPTLVRLHSGQTQVYSSN